MDFIISEESFVGEIPTAGAMYEKRLITPAPLSSKGAHTEGPVAADGRRSPLHRTEGQKEEATREFCSRCLVSRDTLCFSFMYIHLLEGCLLSMEVENILFNNNKKDTKSMICFLQGTDLLNTLPALPSLIVATHRHTQTTSKRG